VYQEKPILIQYEGQEAQITSLDAPSAATA
jgi:hypothetical protein